MFRRSNKSAGLAVSNGVATLLIGLLAVELQGALPWPVARAPARIAPQAVIAKIVDLGSPPPSATAAWDAKVLARPLFAPSRRPAKATPAPAPRMEISRLSGIMITPTEAVAVFSPATGGPIIVTKNSRFGSFAVLSITADSVTVTGPDGVIVLHPDIGDQGPPGNSTPVMTILPGGIGVNLIKIPVDSGKATRFFGSNPV